MPGLYYSRFLETFCVLFEHSIEAFESPDCEDHFFMSFNKILIFSSFGSLTYK